MTKKLAYCTNVHAGADLDSTVANLQRHALAVKKQLAGDRLMGIGLWFAAPAAQALVSDGRSDWLADWLAANGLLPFTLNGFPYGDFHQPVVKHRVYEPTWQQAERLAYTLNLIDILDTLLPAGQEGSISTLPIAWGDPQMTSDQWQLAANNLLSIVDRLADMEAAHDRLIYLCIEPEPGCAIGVSDEIVNFFDRYLLAGNDADRISRYLRVCHDICHAAVMFEEQSQVLDKYSQAGIQVGKVQVSSAICVNFDQLNSADRGKALEQLAGFAEDRYLHQTCVRQQDEDRLRFYEDLTDALADVEDSRELHSEWRVHFHVPIYLEQFGWIGTSNDQISKCLAAAKEFPALKHFEVETYAWGVLPAELQEDDLSAGIAREMTWVASLPEFKA